MGCGGRHEPTQELYLNLIHLLLEAGEGNHEPTQELYLNLAWHRGISLAIAMNRHKSCI